MKPCPVCRREVQSEASECPYCGVVFAKWKARDVIQATASNSPSENRSENEAMMVSEQKIRHSRNIIVTGLILQIGLFFVQQLLNLNQPRGMPSGLFVTVFMLTFGGQSLGWVLGMVGLSRFAKAKGRPVEWGVLGLLPVIGPVIGLIVLYKQPALPAKDIVKQSKSLRGSVWIAAALYLLDALVFNQGVIALVTAAAVIFVMLPRALMAAFKKDRALLVRRGIKAAIYTIMVVAVLVSNYLNNQLVQHRAEALIAACKEYREKYEKFPDKLEDLVPEFIPNVPLAKFTLTWNEFRYVPFEGQHGLMWVALPPFGRPSYDFEEDRWGYVD